MNKYCVGLNLGLAPLMNPNELENFDKKLTMTVLPAIGYVNPKLIVLFSKLGLVIDHIEVSYSTPNKFTPIHRDTNNLPTDTTNVYDFIKLNYIFGGKNSLMKWYKSDVEPKKETINTIHKNETGIYITGDMYTLDEVELVHEQELQFPSLVQVGIPHNVQNTNEDRYCLCIVLTKNGKRISMDNALSIFKDYIS